MKSEILKALRAFQENVSVQEYEYDKGEDFVVSWRDWENDEDWEDEEEPKDLKSWEAIKAINEGKKLIIMYMGEWIDFPHNSLQADEGNVLYLISQQGASIRIKK